MQDGDPGKTVDYGVVSDGHGFEDSPDCERISGGINSKGPRAIAIGRQANMLQWGFYAAPDRMTDSAKRAFLNAIVYMRQFDGHRPLVTKASRGRSWLRQYVEILSAKDIADDAREYYRARFPAAAVDETGLEPMALGRWVAANEEYLTYDDQQRAWVLDDDLKNLGLSNRTPKFLDWIVTRLRESPDDEIAQRLAERYLPRDVATSTAKVLTWVEQNTGRVFFSDVGGYRWFVDTRPGGSAGGN